jgi:hypothetical protein
LTGGGTLHLLRCLGHAPLLAQIVPLRGIWVDCKRSGNLRNRWRSWDDKFQSAGQHRAHSRRNNCRRRHLHAY